jgi:hypothetical protein
VPDHFDYYKSQALQDTMHNIEDFVNFMTDRKVDAGHNLDNCFSEQIKSDWQLFRKELLFSPVQG